MAGRQSWQRKDQIEKWVAFQVRGAFVKDSGFHFTDPGNACSQNSAIDTTQPLRLRTLYQADSC